MFDTHCHLNFSVFENNLSEVIGQAKKAGVNYFVVPGTDVKTSKKAVEIAEKYDGIYVAVGIHPHHVCQYRNDSAAQFFHTRVSPRQGRGPLESEKIVTASSKQMSSLISLLSHPKVVAIGEVGIDKHEYKKTKYSNYQIGLEFIEYQKLFLKEQIRLAIKYNKSLIVHNRRATEEVLEILDEPTVAKALADKAVFHCCEPDEELLNFAKEHRIFIGVNGDVTYNRKKQEFVKKIPLELLVLETDSPYLLPEPLKSQKLFPNEPKNLPIIAEFIAKLINRPARRSIDVGGLIGVTTENAKRLFFR